MGVHVSLESDMEPDWRGEVPAGYMATVYVLEDGERIVLGNRNDIYILDGETGAAIDQMEESFRERHRPDLEIAGINLDGAISDVYTLVPVSGSEGSDRKLLFEYQFDQETMMAMEPESVEPLWMQSDYERRADEISFIESSAHDVRDSSTFLLKTFDGLLSVDSEDGAVKWEVSAFDGPGIEDAAQLPNGDHVVLGTGSDFGNLEFSTDYNVARISKSGEVVWRQSHSGTGIDGVHVTSGQVVMDGSPTEVFDLKDGTKLWENEVDKRGRHHNLAVAEGAVYIAGDLESQWVVPVSVDGSGNMTRRAAKYYGGASRPIPR